MSTAFNRALARVHSGDLAGAGVLLRSILASDPTNAAAHHLAGVVCVGLHFADRAVHHAQEANRLAPKARGYANLLGAALSLKNDREGAVKAFREAAAQDPTDSGSLANLGAMLRVLGRFTESEEALRRCLAVAPGDWQATMSLAATLIDTGRAAETAALFEHAVRDKPGDAVLQQSLCFTLNYVQDAEPQRVFAEHRRFGALMEAKAAGGGDAPKAGPRATGGPPGRLRLGYISPDLREHPVASFFEPLLERHDRARFEILCYSTMGPPDQTTARLRGLADHWRDCAGLSDAAVAARVRSDRIDIVIDLAGLTFGGRPGVLALRPARVQATYLGYPHTTGLSSVDFRIVDVNTDPHGAEAFAVERLLRLDPCFLCYKPPGDAPAPSPRASEPSAPPVFASFNALPKITDGVIDAWARVLSSVAGSRLLLKGAALGDDGVRRRIGAAFSARGIAADRVEFLERRKTIAEHLACYHRVDVALDTFPYNGTTTTCEALWMGVPVVSLAGGAHAGRVGVSLLNAVGAPELIAESPAEYVRIASALADDPARVAGYRESLQSRMAGSALCDAQGFASRFERALHEMWESVRTVTIARQSP